jgi:hypothetical protein
VSLKVAAMLIDQIPIGYAVESLSSRNLVECVSRFPSDTAAWRETRALLFSRRQSFLSLNLS